MAHNTPTSLDYLKLLAEEKLSRPNGVLKTLKIAILADCATQHLVPVLRALATRRNVALDIYAADYDSIDTEIHNLRSGFYDFAPRYVIILVATEHLKARLYGAQNGAEFVTDTINRFTMLWDALKQHMAATIIQGTYVLPSERAFGHYELKAEESVGSLIAEVNYQLIQHARIAGHVLLCDVDYLAAEVGRRQWQDETLWSLAKGLCRLDYLPLLGKALVDIVLAAEGRFTKCVVLDLDNTLWGGVIGDDGLAGIALGDIDEGDAFVGFQRFIRALKKRGIILAVVSKNNEATALLPFRDHPDMVLREDDIAVFIANWDNKADNIRLVQKILNIGFDSMVFLDDNPMERDLVRQFLPDVIVPDLPDDPVLYLRTLAGLNLFETASYSSADTQRPGQYRQAAQRELSKSVYHDIGTYLQSLEMTIKIERFSAFQLPRIAQLIQRSNQFNLTTQRHNQAACEAMMSDPDCVPFTVTLADKFGDYGLISVVVLRLQGQSIEIETYLMSCRVLQRGVEQFVMTQIFALAQRLCRTQVVGRYRKSPKNSMVQNFYADFGFHHISGDADGDTEWALAVDAYQPRDVFITPRAIEI